MPIDITWETRGAYKKFSGFVTASEFIRGMESLHNDPRFDQLHWTINDCLAVTGHSVTPATVEHMAISSMGAYHSNPRIRVAIVARDEQIEHLVALFNSPALHSYPAKLFPTLAEARAWVESAVTPG